MSKTPTDVISQAYCHPKAAERYVEVTELSILVTDSNTIHIWYLPDALSPKRRADIWNCLHLLREPLQESIKASPQAWQMDKSYFCDNAELKGAIKLSPAWFQQGHGPQNGFLEASWLLKSRMENTSTREWVDQMSDTNALLSVILHVIHLQIMSMMVNQATCYHRDINGQDPWYDMLVTVGNYLPLDFVIPTLNLQLCYNPGMIIAFSGSALEHGVGAVDGDRACLAYYMHANTSCNWRTVDLKLQNLMICWLLNFRCFDIIDWVGTQS
ncbi:hypothetical protein F5J12DRAFT_781842 [Pisolithus orientalis]|uniref:uncharacterized protein n=1 Tax=Pisolithus orientalis TaxID=936130 RepID=UPI002225054E|nr:uncharacterized protein F5J12DRAFT_781842 [Pisolithus orientalis]KAI6010869.1 hypothetical protein F5J12DRAFT_781842 [Pisolithus orientalis]